MSADLQYATEARANDRATCAMDVDSESSSPGSCTSRAFRPDEEEQRAVLQGPRIDFAKLARTCRQGVSDWARPMMWKVMIGFYSTTPSHWLQTEQKSENEYNAIIAGSCELDDAGDPILNNAVGWSIDADIPRTMPSLNFFLEPDSPVELPKAGARRPPFTRAQRSLRRITCTIASVNKAFGYVQGMTQLVAHLLYGFCEGKTNGLTRQVEASVFFCFQTMLGYLGDDFCRVMDDDKDSGVISTIRHFDNVLQFVDMPLYDHLQSLGIGSEHFALRWLMLLFTQEFNIADSLRVWDFLLSFGSRMRGAALFVAAAMCHHQREAVLSQDCLSEVMPLLLDYPPCDTNEFLRTAMSWISKYEFSLIAELKNASRENIIALRLKHGLEQRPALTSRVQNWVYSFF